MKMHRSRIQAVWKAMPLVALAGAVWGCAGAKVKQTTVVPPAARPVAKDATQEELLERYNSFARKLKSVNTAVELKPTAGTKYSGVIDQYHEVKAFLLASRPWNIRMIGQVPVVGKTVFDMASDGKTFQVSIPPKNKFLTGPATLERTSSKPIENLRPQHLLEALLWPEVRKEEPVLLEEFNDETARYYVLTVLRGGYKTEILRKIWFDRADLHVVRLQSYGPRGALLSDVRYADWQPVEPENGTASNVNEFPRKIRIERPHDEYTLEMTVTKVTLNEPMDPSRFRLDPPPGAELVTLGEERGETKQ
jgi:hypothetical protein